MTITTVTRELNESYPSQIMWEISPTNQLNID